MAHDDIAAMQGTKLRVGLLVDGMSLPAWQHRMVALVKQSDYAEIVLVVANASPAQERRSGSGARRTARSPVAQVWNAMVSKALLAAERLLVGKPGYLPDALEAKNLSELVDGVEVLSVGARWHEESDWIVDQDVEGIAARNIDVLIRLGFRNLRGGILSAARYGVWSCLDRDNMANGEAPAGYWEVMQSLPEIESVAQILAPDGKDHKVIYRSFATTNAMSLADNRNNVQWKTLHFIPRKLKELHELGAERFFASTDRENACPRFYDRFPRTFPNNRERGVLIWKKLLQKIRRKLDDRWNFAPWCLFFDIGTSVSTALWQFRCAAPPKDRLWADPFVVARDDKYFVFIEEFVYAKQRGHISVLVMDREGHFESPTPVLETPYHLSYPFVFEFEGEMYMVPESKVNRTVELYKCTSFPYRWTFQKNLMENCQAVDPTLVEWQGKWWLFINKVETEGASLWDELWVYYSDTPLSDNWTPHPRNPVVSDSRSARPAGRMFERQGRLFRPSQNCAGRYGYGCNINEVIKLTETEYEERVVGKIEPKWNARVLSTHTFNYEDGLTIVDGQIRRRR